MKLLLDTCAVLYCELDPKRLSGKARAAIAAEDAEVYVAAISVAELAQGWGKRFILKKHWKPWLREAVQANGWQVLPMDWDIVEEAYALPQPFHRDPADRLIVATARLHDLAIVTNDSLITEYPYVTVCW